MRLLVETTVPAIIRETWAFEVDDEVGHRILANQMTILAVEGSDADVRLAGQELDDVVLGALGASLDATVTVHHLHDETIDVQATDREISGIEVQPTLGPSA